MIPDTISCWLLNISFSFMLKKMHSPNLSDVPLCTILISCRVLDGLVWPRRPFWLRRLGDNKWPARWTSHGALRQASGHWGQDGWWTYNKVNKRQAYVSPEAKHQRYFMSLVDILLPCLKTNVYCPGKIKKVTFIYCIIGKHDQTKVQWERT